MQSTLSVSFSQATASTAICRSRHGSTVESSSFVSLKPVNLRFCGLRREAFGFSSSRTRSNSSRAHLSSRRLFGNVSVSASLAGNGTPPKSFDYDLIIIGAGVGGHGAALHAVEKVILMISWILSLG